MNGLMANDEGPRCSERRMVETGVASAAWRRCGTARVDRKRRGNEFNSPFGALIGGTRPTRRLFHRPLCLYVNTIMERR